MHKNSNPMQRFHMQLLPLIAIMVSFPSVSTGQASLAEKLGYAADAKLLIVHADDIGLAQSVNAATGEAFASGGITSGSIMVPRPWFIDFAQH
jgi:hypothetical protein